MAIKHRVWGSAVRRVLIVLGEWMVLVGMSEGVILGAGWLHRLFHT